MGNIKLEDVFMKAHFLDKNCTNRLLLSMSFLITYIQSIVDLIRVRSDFLDQLFGDLDKISDHYSNKIEE